MKLITLCIILSSLAVSGFFSPNPHKNDEQVIVRDGHRSVAVEYDDQVGDGNTKVSISPPHDTPGEKESGGSGPRELICDAYGKCKHKVAGVLSRAKGTVEETVGEKIEDAKDVIKDSASKVGDVKDKVKDSATWAEEKVKETGDRVKDSAFRAAYEVGDAKAKVKDSAMWAEEKVGDVKDKVKDSATWAEKKVGDAKDRVKDSATWAEEKLGTARDKVKETVKEGEEKAKEEGRRGKKVISDIFKGVITYVFGFGLGSVGNLMNLMGASMAYGIGVWVTFVMSYVLGGVLSRQQFGMVQSKMYPVYFKAMVGSIGLSLLGHLIVGSKGKMLTSMAHMLQGCNLLSSFLMVLANLLFFEPRATKVMFQRMKLEKEEGRGIDGGATPIKVVDTAVTDTTTGEAPTTTTRTTMPATTAASRTEERVVAKSKLGKLDEGLKKLNSNSSLLNVMTLMGLTWHLVYLSQRLGVTTY